MGEEFLKFREDEIGKQGSHSPRRTIDIDNVDIVMIPISDEFPCSKKSSKYFVDYVNNEKAVDVQEISIMLTSCLFFTKDIFFVKYNKIWSKITSIIKNVMVI